MENKCFVENPLALCSQLFLPDFSFDRKGFCENVESLLSRKLFVPYICCTAGEGYALSHSSYKELVKLFAELTKSYELPSIVGVLSTSLAEMNERVEIAENYGIHNIMFALPSWGIMNPEEVDLFLDSFFSSHPSCNFIHYNNSARSGVRLYADDYERICEKHSNFVAVKQCYAQPIDAIKMAQKGLPLVEYYLEYMYTVACLYERPSLLPSVLCCNYDVAEKYYRAGQEKDFKTLTEIDEQAMRASQVIGRTLPPNGIDGTYDKCFDRLNHPSVSQRLLPPYIGASDEQFEEFAKQLRISVPEWFS